MLNVGQVVQIKRTVHIGSVTRFVLNSAGTEVMYVVKFKDHDGVDQERAFRAEELEVKESQ